MYNFVWLSARGLELLKFDDGQVGHFVPSPWSIWNSPSFPSVLPLYMWGAVGWQRQKAIGDCVHAGFISCCVLSVANAECFPRLEWQSSGRPVVRLSSFLQAVHGYPSRKEACRTLAYAATSLTVLKSPSSQGGCGWRMETARMPGSPSPTVLDVVG